MTTTTLAGAPGFEAFNAQWQRLGDFEFFEYVMLAVDEARGDADFILKFEPNKKIFLHRHGSLTYTMVLQGEHRIYEPNGALKEIRPLGSYTMSQPGDPHSEGGGTEGALVLYSCRGQQGVHFEVLDAEFNVVATLTMDDFVALFNAEHGAGR